MLKRQVTLCALLLLCVAAFGAACRRDMQDQPRYEALEGSDFFKDGKASRRPVENTVPRGYLREDRLLYAGKNPAGQVGTGNTSAGAAANQMNASAPQSNPGGTGDAQQTQVTNQTATPQNERQSDNPQPTGSSAAQTPAAGTADEATVFPFPISSQGLDRGQELFNAYCSMCHGMTGYGDGMIVRRGFRRPTSYHTDQLRGANVGHFFDVITNGFGAMPNYAAQIAPRDRWLIVAYIRTLQMSQNMNIRDIPAEARERLLNPQQHQGNGHNGQPRTGTQGNQAGGAQDGGDGH